MEGGVVVSALVKTLCDKLGSPLFNEFSLVWGVDKQLKAFESTISAVKDVLEDAEQCLTMDKAEHNWLQKLKDNVYDADDLLGKWYLEAQRQQNDPRCQTSRGINNTLSRLNLVKRLKLAHNIESITKKLDAVAAERTKFHLKSKTIEYTKYNVNDQETWSHIDESAIYGRNHEKEEILKWLIQKDVQQHISVISIVGLGGLGKTTLAQLVYNSEALNEHFNLKKWIYVSEIFDVRRIVSELTESTTQTKYKFQNLDSLGEKGKNELNGKRFLLVLDDVWDKNCEQNWEKLIPILNNGASGSKIIVTTRFLSVSQKMNAIFCSKLKGLPETISWDLFKQRVGGSEIGVNSRIIEIAKQIVQKCAGVPLALKALGGNVRFEDSIEKWLNLRDSDIWDLSYGGDQVIKSLKLSYMYLPPSLKECFTYCSIFSKGQVIDKLELIGQWMAHGFICVSGGKGTAQEKGNEYFKHLVQISFLQNVVGGSNMGQVTCKMHDLVHDLARSIVTHEFSVMNDLHTPSNIGINCRYMSLSNYSGKVKPSIIKKVRALHMKGCDLAAVNMISLAKSLRALVLNELHLRKEWNICSKKLIHLGYVCFSECDFEEIPIDFCALWSLQSLHLEGCRYIKKLPESIGRVIGLETLKLKCENLESLPGSIGQCRNLQTLIVHSKKLERIPNSISQLENIRSFYLVQCCELKRLPDEVFEKCSSIRSISFYNCQNLEEIPASIGSLVNLESLNLSKCKSLKSLPNSICDLQNLHSLDLSSSGIMVLPSSIHKLVNLETLDVRWCYKLKELPGSMGEMKNLRFLDMEDTNMEGMPIGIGKLTDLRRLHEFVVAEESKFARISELEHLNLLGGSLTISGLDKVSDPIEVVQANLKHKKYLEELTLEWSSYEGDSVSSYEGDSVAVLEALQPPSGIKILWLRGYSGSEYSLWMMPKNKSMSSLPYLTSLCLNGLNKCTHVPLLVELPCLRYLHLVEMDSLKTFTSYCQGLVELVLVAMENLEELTTTRLVPCGEHEINNAYESAFPNLSSLRVSTCPKLTIKPHLPPSLQELELNKSNEELLTGAVFSGGEAASQISFPSLGLKELRISQMKLLTEWQLLGQISSLRELEFFDYQFGSFSPIGMRHCTSLLVLRITDCVGIDSLPEWFGELRSLQRLHIWHTPLTCLPQSMQQLTELKSLKIWRCPELGKRCERENGEDWHLISHIPDVSIW